MPFFDMPLDELKTYRPDVAEPADFDIFWQKTLAETRAYALDAEFVPYDAGLSLVDVYDVTYRGYGGQPVRAWYIRPAGVTEALPCVVQYIGYGGGRSYPWDWLFWANAGLASFVMDTRGQGSVSRPGDTADLPDGANPHTPGFMTQGILDPHTYYYRRVFTDAVRAIEAARSRGDVDGQRIAVTGGSQGGGISIAAAGLVPDVALCMPDVPFLCHFRRSVGLTTAYPYQEIVTYLAVHREKIEAVFSTLSYFDGVNMARRIRAASLFSVGLMDPICAPSSIYAAFNQLQAEAEMAVYAYNEHEGGSSLHDRHKRAFVRRHWAV